MSMTANLVICPFNNQFLFFQNYFSQIQKLINFLKKVDFNFKINYTVIKHVLKSKRKTFYPKHINTCNKKKGKRRRPKQAQVAFGIHLEQINM